MCINQLLALFVIIVSLALNDKLLGGVEAQETTIEAEECINPNKKLGVCIPLTKCPKLFHILKENPLKIERVKFLQRATCNFQHDEPWVCCVSGKDNNDQSGDGVNKQVTKPSTLNATPQSSTSTIPLENDDLSIPYKNHANWKLMPDIRTCGNSLLTDRIIGGTNAGLGTYPWMALIAYLDPSGEIQYACGGTVMTSRYILTASHCITNLPEGFSVSFVRLGEYNRKKDPDCLNGLCAPKMQDIPVEEIIPHEQFDVTGRTENDIALLRLQKEIAFSAFVTPICLPCQRNILKHRLVKNNHTYVAGWGRYKFNSDAGSDILQHIHVPVQAKRDCNAYYSKLKIGNVDETRFCAGGETGKDSCQGDSGGPLMETIFNEKLVQAQTWQFGIVSLGPSPCGSANPALYTNVSHFIPWILDHLRP